MLLNSKYISLLASIGQYFAQDANLSSQQLKRLSEHKYSAADNSVMDTLFMNKFWNSIVKFYPLWVAPNLITITGLLFNMTSVLVLSYFSPGGTSVDAPRWTYLMCAVSLFIYQTLDATDGKQARRTNTCSPLGELFDHGCDSLSQVFVALEVALSLLLGHHPSLFLFLCVSAEAIFYCAHWQTYVSGTLMFGKFDVTESQFLIIATCILTALFGPNVWLFEIVRGFQLRFFYLAFGALVGSVAAFRYFRLIFTGGVGKNGSTVADTSIIYPVFPLLAVVLPQILIYNRSKTGDITAYLVLFCISFGIVSAKVTTKLVVAHMTRSPLSSWDSIFFGPLILVFNQYMDTAISEYYALWICLIYCTVNFLCYCTQLCRVICVYLNIQCFRIPYVTDSTPRPSKKLIANGFTHWVTSKER